MSLYDIMVTILDIFLNLMEGCCLCYYFEAFMQPRISHKTVGRFTVIGVYFAAEELLGRVLINGLESITTLGKMLVMFGVVLLIAAVLYKAEYQMVLFLSVTFAAIKDICAFLSVLVSVWGTKSLELWIFLLEKGYISSPDTIRLIEGTAILIQALMSMAYAGLFFWSFRSILKNYKEKDYRIRQEELLFILTPGLVGFLFCVLFRTIFITINNDMPQTIYEKYPLLMAVIPLILFLSLLSILYGVKLFQDMIRLNREKSNRVILEKQVQHLQEHIREIEHIYSGVRSMKHDMKNTLSVIGQLALEDKNRSNRDLQSYLSQLNQTMDRLDFPYKTGNSVVDILLNMKNHEAARIVPGLRINADRLLCPDNLQIQSYDLGIILGNALDNAIEACRKLKEKEPPAELFITLSTFRKGRMFFIEVENSFDGNVIRSVHSGLPMTDKADKKNHGIGLANIKNTAGKYHGDVDWAVQHCPEGGYRFTLTVMLQNEKRQD